MHQWTALRTAIALVHLPSLGRSLKSEPLPQGIELLLRIAAGDERVTAEAVRHLSRSPDTVKGACAFYIEQILLCPTSNYYRVLGTEPHCSAAELRTNMGQLLKWVHPDASVSPDRAHFALRVTEAWNSLKTPERRALYDSQRHAQTRHRSVNTLPDKFGDSNHKHRRKLPSAKRRRHKDFLHRFREFLSGL
jgi:DnaJ-like protein